MESSVKIYYVIEYMEMVNFEENYCLGEFVSETIPYLYSENQEIQFNDVNYYVLNSLFVNSEIKQNNLFHKFLIILTKNSKENLFLQDVLSKKKIDQNEN